MWMYQGSYKADYYSGGGRFEPGQEVITTYYEKTATDNHKLLKYYSVLSGATATLACSLALVSGVLFSLF